MTMTPEEVRSALTLNHEYELITRVPGVERYDRRWRMGYIGESGLGFQFSARGPDRTHKAQYGGTQTLRADVIKSIRQVPRDERLRHTAQRA